MSENKLANPAVVGLAGFGLTTFILQLHNLGLAGTGVVLAPAFIFGGLAQMIAGFQEQKTGNHFGYSAFVSFGAFWIGLGIIWLLEHFKIFTPSKTDVGWYLVVWTLYTLIMFVISLRVHKAMAITFGLLLAGFVLLDVGHFGPAIFNVIAAYILIGCALGAWYIMASIIFQDVAGKVILPMGKPFWKN